MLRAHEHDVFEQMCEAGAAYQLVARADVIPGVDGNDRRGVIFVKNYLEAVRQFVLLELDPRDRLRIQCARGGSAGN